MTAGGPGPGPPAELAVAGGPTARHLARAVSRSCTGVPNERPEHERCMDGDLRPGVPHACTHRSRGGDMPNKSANVKNEKQYEALKDKGMSKQRAAKIANSPDASKHGGQQSGKGGDSSQGGTTAQKKKAGRKGGKASSDS